MLAMDYRGPYRVRLEEKPMPKIEHPRDAIVRVTRSCICGSDLHLYHGLVPDTRVGMTFGHEFCGIVEQVGGEVENLKAGDHVLVPFNIACGQCHFCKQGLFGNCHESNPQATASAACTAIRTRRGLAAARPNMCECIMPISGRNPRLDGPDDAVLLTDVVPTGYQRERRDQAAIRSRVRRGAGGSWRRAAPGCSAPAGSSSSTISITGSSS